MDWQTVISTAVGVVAGGLITAYFSWQGSKKLRREAARLGKLIDLVLRGLEAAGFAEYNRDEEGNITGIHIDLSGSSASFSSASEDLQAERTEDTVRSEEPAEQDTS